MSNRIVFRFAAPAAVVLMGVACLGTDQTGIVPGDAIDSVTFKSVVAGSAHSCGIVEGNYAYCWGDNTAGQLGVGDLLNHAIPRFVDGGELEFRQITAGGIGACALTADQDAYCWGQNQFGQVGNGVSLTPPLISPEMVLGGLKFTELTGGGVHNCGLVGAGDAYCWGLAGNGQLGNGQTGSETAVTQPSEVSGGLQFKELSAGTAHTCGVTSSGAAYCWGNGSNGELGDGLAQNSPVPVEVSGDILFEFIDAGDDHSCGIDLEGNAYCWGVGADGQLGTGLRSSSDVPVAVAGGLSFISITAGKSFTCGIDATERAYCWGRNAAGELGDGTLELRTEPTLVAGNLEFSTISAGQGSVTASTCGFTLTDRVYCWGEGTFGQLGTGNTSSSTVPVEVAGQK